MKMKMNVVKLETVDGHDDHVEDASFVTTVRDSFNIINIISINSAKPTNF